MNIGKKIVLASKSPRRQDLMKLLNLDFEVRLEEVDESYSASLPKAMVPVYLAEKKAKAFGKIPADTLVITADTIVLLEGEILGKPESLAGAKKMLSQLSGKMHEVITGVALADANGIRSFSDTTKVYFKLLNPKYIDFYVEHYQPLDKAGSYGIQEWIGLIGIEKIEGSYTNVVGLPTEVLWRELAKVGR